MFSKYVLDILLWTVKFLGLGNNLFLKLVSIAKIFLCWILEVTTDQGKHLSWRIKKYMHMLEIHNKIFVLSPLQLTRIEFEFWKQNTAYM